MPVHGDLRSRWTPDLVHEGTQALRQQEIFEGFPPLTIHGQSYQDLRGLPLREPIRDVTFAHVDFTSASFGHAAQFYEVTALDCVFMEATLDMQVGGLFRRCRFDRAVLEGAAIIAWTTFSECSFEQADLRNAHGSAVTFDRCNFSGANLRSARFLESEFHACVWKDVRLAHTSLVESKITRDGFPEGRDVQTPGRLLPDVLLDRVEWLDSLPEASWAIEFERVLEARAAAKRDRARQTILNEAKAAYKERRFDDAIARFSAAARLGPLDALSEKMLTMARRQKGPVGDQSA